MLYNFCLFLYLLFLVPKTIYDYIFFKKKKKDLLNRLGLKKYNFNIQNKKPIIWIHAVSLGETKAAKSIFDKLKKEYPKSYIVISNTTQTGHNEAKKSFFADKCIFFPYDFSYIIKKIFSQIKPNIIIFVETDLWLNFIKEAKKNHSKVIIVSAKISEKSTKRFSKLPFFSKELFSYVDLILSQNEIYQERFSKFITKEKIKITGNLKLVNNVKNKSKQQLRQWLIKLNVETNNIITIASTHFPEETLIINELKDIPNTKLLLAPRHPERFNEVYKLVKKITSCTLLSDLSDKNAKVILIDQMGLLNTLYQISTLAIVGGSYINKVGGHNILEPIFVNTPVFFGPFMYSQLELKEIVLKANCGKQVDLIYLKQSIVDLFQDAEYKQNLIDNCLKMKNISKNILENTFNNINKLILNI